MHVAVVSPPVIPTSDRGIGPDRRSDHIYGQVKSVYDRPARQRKGLSKWHGRLNSSCGHLFARPQWRRGGSLIENRS